MEEIPITTVVAIAGFLAGGVLGATVQRTNFCTMGAVSDVVFMGDYRRFRSWLLAMAVALIGTQVMHAMGVVDIYTSLYLSPNLGWLGAVAGGLMFGFGMTLTGGCANRNLVRIGGGNLKSVVVILVMGIFAYMTNRGLIGLARVEMEALSMIDLTQSGLQSQGMADMIAAAAGTGVEGIRWAITALLAVGLLVICFKDAGFRSSPENIVAGLVVGAMVSVGWWITGVLGFDEFEPTQLNSISFVNPSGDSLQYLMTFTGATINFGVSTVGGMIVGAFGMAVATRTFHVEAFVNSEDMIRHLVGAALMGVGGIMALGCTIGQGVTGISTLSLGSLLALLSILAGAVYGFKYLEEGSFSGAFGALFSAD